jgi:hypothetical protein
METTENKRMFIDVKTYQITMPSGYSCFIGADQIDIDDKGYLIFSCRGEFQAMFNIANIAGYRKV